MSDQPPVTTGLGVAISPPPKPTAAAPHHKAGARLKAYAVLGRPDGALVWNTVRSTAADAWNAYDRFNPGVAGYPSPAQLVELDITIKPELPLFAARIAQERG